MISWLVQQVRESAAKLRDLADVPQKIARLRDDFTRDMVNAMRRVTTLEKSAMEADAAIMKRVADMGRDLDAVRARLAKIEDLTKPSASTVMAAALTARSLGADGAEVIHQTMKPKLDAIVRDVNQANARAENQLRGLLDGAQDDLTQIRASLTRVEDLQIDQGKRLCDLEEKAHPPKKPSAVKRLPAPKEKP